MKKLKDFLKKTTTLALGTLTLFGIALSVTSKNSTNIIGANAAGPYYVSGNFNGWSTSNTPMTSMLNGRYFYYEIDYSQTGWNSGNREFKINPNWIGASNLKEYGKMLGFGGSDNITSPSTPEAGAYLLTIRDSSKEINVYKNVYLIGTFNSWKLADASYKMSINAGKFEFTMDLDMSSQFKFVFKNSWDYQIGADALTQASKDLGFGGTDNITSTSIVPGKYNVTFYPGVNEIDISKPTYTVTKFKGSTQIGTENVWVSEANYKPSFVYQQGYNFEGWYTDVSLTTPWNNEAILGNMNLYGKYTPTSDYYIYFRKPDTWGTSINVHYWWSGSGASLSDTTTWPGLQMTKVMGTDHGYVAKIDAGYSPNRVMFNDGTNKTEDGGVLLEPGKVYTFNETENKTYAIDFEYRIYKGWSPWDDETSTLKENKYKAGESSVTLAVKKGDLVKMNISSQIWAPFNKLTGTAASSFIESASSGNYEAVVDGVFTFTWTHNYTLGTNTTTRTGQITADESTITVVNTTDTNEIIVAVNERIADINTCDEVNSYSAYATFVMNTLGSLDDVTEANQAKLNLMYAHSSNPALRGSRTLFASRNKTETYEALGIISIMTLIALFGYKALNRKKNA